MPRIPDWLKQPFAEALEYQKEKIALPVDTINGLEAEYHDSAFVVSGLTRADLTSDMKWLVEKAIEEGMDFEDFQRQFDRLIGRKGWQPGGVEGKSAAERKVKSTRLYTILDTNVRRSHAAGRIRQAREPELLKRRPYWMWIWRDSVQPRPHHEALNGKVFLASDPFWDVATPPCFTPETLVATPNGWQQIGGIKQGDLVIGGSGNVQPTTAIHITKFSNNVIRLITQGSLETLATPNHRFLTLRGWVKAVNLRLDDVLVQIREATFCDALVGNINQSNACIGDSTVSLPVNRQSSISKTFNIEEPEGFASGAPLDNFNSLDDFVRWASSHAVLYEIDSITTQLYIGNVYDLSIENDETYCVRTSVVHNCGYGCRCSFFALSDRDLKRMGKTVETPPDPKTIADPGFRRAPGTAPIEEREEILKKGLARQSDEVRQAAEEELKKNGIL